MRHRLLTPAVAIAVITAAALTVTPAAAGASLARPTATPAALPSFVVVDHASSLKVYNTSTGAAVGTLNAPEGQKFQGVANGGTSQTFLAYASPASTSAGLPRLLLPLPARRDREAISTDITRLD